MSPRSICRKPIGGSRRSSVSTTPAICSPVTTTSGLSEPWADELGGSPTVVGLPSAAVCPLAELVGIANDPDPPDLIAGDLERVHGNCFALVDCHEPGLAVDGSFQQFQGADSLCQVDEVPRDSLAAFDGLERCADETAAVGDGDGRGIEQVDERADVLGLPRLLEAANDASALCRRRLDG